jgi:hypothetical protein
MINKSSTLAGIIRFNNGNRTRIHVGANGNTSEIIIWQELMAAGSNAWKPAKRITGRNLRLFVEELNFVLNEGEACWEQAPASPVVIARLKTLLNA